MKEILGGLLPLAIVIACNMALGIYHKIGVEKLYWSWPVFLQGIIKAAIVGGTFIGLAYVFEGTALRETGVTPGMIMGAAILLYAGKGCRNLAGILGVEEKHA